MQNVEVRNCNHSHQPSPDEVIVRQAVTRMREAAVETTNSMHQIYRQATVSLASNSGASAIIPTFKSVDSALYRKRRRLTPALPTKKSELDIPDCFRSTNTGEPFLLEATADNEILIFCTPTDLRLLCEADIVAMDGTFDSVPALYAQLFTLHAFFENKQLPLVYCLMSGKTRDAYASVFNILKDKAQQQHLSFAPSIFLSDFETGLIAAVRDEFPNATHRGCYFHFTQVNRKYVAC